MSSTLDRLRRLHSLRRQRNRPELTYEPIDEDGAPLAYRPSARQGALAELVPGEEVATDAGTCYVVTHAYALEEARGYMPLGAVLQLPPAALAPFHPEFALGEESDFHHAAFVDTETTGIGAGASVYAFMVGVGTFETVPPAEPQADQAGPGPRAQHPTHFVVRQYFMRHPGEEAALLSAVATQVAGMRLAVTFNGRTFDLPLLRARYQQNRQLIMPNLRAASLFEEDRPHLDLLLPARRLWRRRLQSCRLINLEQMILGLQRTEDDVPGFLIPQLYVDYMRSGEAGEMRRVFYHNREDIVSMVALAHRLIQAYATPEQAQESAALEAEDWLSLGICFEKRGEGTDAEQIYRRALDEVSEERARGDVFARLGALLKRQGRWEEAAALWQQWLTSVDGADITPFIELSKYCEWQTGDLEQAEMWAAWGLHTLKTLAPY
ncbi:MAG: ribonuclease H-like domain-containing protein, partial [Caldilineaceae bacterium]|nr:ribonuclease H-like domain-containing protein [Caldilineaceae bacterium]